MKTNQSDAVQTEIQVFLVRFRNKEPEVALARTKNGSLHPWDSYRATAETSEMFEQAAMRVLSEQAKVSVQKDSLRRVAITEFTTREGKPLLLSHVFLCHQWVGNPRKTPEKSRPSWFSREELPASETFPGISILLREVLGGKRVRLRFVLDRQKTKVLKHKTESVCNL